MHMNRQVNWVRVKAIAVIAAVAIFAPLVVQAASPNFPALGSSIMHFNFHITGATTATTLNVAKFTAPFNMRLLYATVAAQAKSTSASLLNSHGSSKVSIMNNGVEAMIMDLVQPAAAAVQEATPVSSALQNVVRDTPVGVDITMWGSSPSVTHLFVVIWAQRNQ
jgi:hypothetical protein